MASLTHSLSIFTDGSLQVEGNQPGSLPPGMTFVRVRHELELGSHLRFTPLRRPEVRPFFPNHHVDFTKPWQLKSKELNPLATPNNWTMGYDFRLWVTNNQGFGMDGSGDRPYDPRANFVTGEDLGSNLPRVEALTCGGNLLRVIGEKMEKTNRGLEDCWIVEALDYRDAPPDVIPPWLRTTAVNLDGNRTPRRFEQAAQPNGFIPGFFHPLLADPLRVVCIPKWRVAPWTANEPPDPYKIYIPQ